MVLSYYLIKFPYQIVWSTLNLLGKTDDVMLYCANTLDYQIFANVQKHLPPIPVIAKNKKVQQELKKIGVESKTYPVFPKGVIMCRQAAYKFPSSNVIKVGMGHGPYTFKPFANRKGYNMFDYYFMTSDSHVENAKKAGIKSGVAIGYPKLDPAFNGEYKQDFLNDLKQKAHIDSHKPTILFTSTWNKSGISAVEKWYDKLDQLTDKYNVLVTVHTWTEAHIKQKIKHTSGVYFIDTPDVVPFIYIADVCIGDMSSILAECSALDKPMVTFKVAENKRVVPEVKQLISEFSEQVEDFAQLKDAIANALATPQRFHQQRVHANQVMFKELNGQAGQRAAQFIKNIFNQLN